MKVKLVLNGLGTEVFPPAQFNSVNNDFNLDFNFNFNFNFILKCI